MDIDELSRLGFGVVEARKTVTVGIGEANKSGPASLEGAPKAEAIPDPRPLISRHRHGNFDANFSKMRTLIERSESRVDYQVNGESFMICQGSIDKAPTSIARSQFISREVRFEIQNKRKA